MAGVPFDWSKFLTLAVALSNNADEASHRSSISRAYYSVYHTASDRATSLGYVPPRSSQHHAIWTHYQSRADYSCRKLGAIGLRMKRRRVEADYDALAPHITVNVPLQIADATKFFSRMRQLPSHLPNPDGTVTR
jgi:uncharacterized protein (UPF0332 family)